MRKLFVVVFILIANSSLAQPQPEYWQQKVHYDMDIDMKEDQYQFSGKQKLQYINNSPDTLNQVFYHLYFNAFQPNSMMDERSRTILDPDRRVRDRIQKLKPDQIGYHKVKSLTQNGKTTTYHIESTTLEVKLAEPILPGDTTIFKMEFDSQVPLQIRRSGRDNREGVRFSMTQWYPKMAEYDGDGWHTSPYIGREFYGVYGTFDVKITIDSSYTIGGTGVLQNPEEIGHGYINQKQVNTNGKKRLTWHFNAENVHDFAWAADPDFVHYKVKEASGVDVHIIYQPNNYSGESWKVLGEYTSNAISFISENFGQYPYPQFTVIQGGDGGMEYPMATLITGNRSLGSLVGVTVHELSHMWYYGVLGFNESYYSWMDEGFTQYSSAETMAYLFQRKGDPHARSYGGYLYLKYRNFEEPLTTHSDHYKTNSAYSTAAYTMGQVFLNQLGYIVGKDVLKRSLVRFFNEWKFKHPDGEDLIHIVEKESGMVLDWYYDYWIKSTRDIDYCIKKVDETSDSLNIKLVNKGTMPMPVDVFVQYEDDSYDFYTIPLVSMRGEKRFEGNIVYSVLEDWAWTHDNYDLKISKKGKKVKNVVLDPTNRMADLNRINNKWKDRVDSKFLKPASPSWDQYGMSSKPTIFYGQNLGLSIGRSSYGSYIFNQHAIQMDFAVTSGNLSTYDVANTDVNYTFKYSNPAKYSGNSAAITWEASRYYGIFFNQVDFEKYIGEYGRWSKERKKLNLSFFHQQLTANRTVDAYDGWQRGAVLGVRLNYEIGYSDLRGIKFSSQIASSNGRNSASVSSVLMNYTYNPIEGVSTRFGFQVASGSRNLPTQYRITAAGPTLEGAWQNPAWFGLSNIDNAIINDAQFVLAGGNGLLGYGLPGIGSPDIAGNNHFSATIWNNWNPFNRGVLKPTTFELVSGIGKSWDGGFFSDNPFADDSPNQALLASMFVGMSYDVSKLSFFDNWRPQSSFIRNLALSVRMPFFMNDLRGRSDWNTLLVFGVSNSF